MKWFWIALALMIAWLLGPFLFKSHVPAFRDGFHFYYPQAVWLDSCYGRGDYFPQWNPQEGLGSSVAGQPTWQLYYPLRTLWLLPVLDVAQRYAVFVAVHLLLAVVGMLRLGKMLGFSSPASCIGALAYVLSCPVFFQLNNLIYLCSATWVAWGLIPVLRLVSEKPAAEFWNRLRFYAGVSSQIAITGSLMSLAGDPHGAVNFALVLLIAGMFRCWLRYSNSAQLALLLTDRPTSTLRSLGLGISAGVLLGLAIYQTQTALPWYRLSSRADAKVLVKDSFHPAVNELLQDTTLIQSQRIFDFSLSPWNLPTIVWPSWAGHFQPQHSRWIQAIPSEGRMWIPSLYIGIVPLLLAIDAIRRKPERRTLEKFLAGLCLLSTLLAMGDYSMVWILRNIFDGLGAASLADRLSSDAVGSLYGVLNNFVPGYGSFRYPAKWSVWIVASLSVLAACGFDRQVKSGFADTRLVPWMIGVAGANILICAVVMTAFAVESVRTQFATWISNAADSMLGSPNSTASILAIVQSLLHPALVLIVAAMLLRRLSKGSIQSVQRLSWLMVVILVFDLGIAANNWIIGVESSAALDRQAEATSVSNLVWANAGRAEVRMVSKQISPEYRESLLLQEKFLQGKLNHLYGYAALHASGSIEPQAIVVLKRWLQRTDDLKTTQPKLDRVLSALGVQQRLVQNDLGQLVWKQIDGTKPLCEFFPDGRLPSKVCNYKWLSSDELEIEVDGSSDGKLLIRQLNDGGWKVTSTGQLPVELVPGELFIACTLSEGRQKITLRRSTQ